MIRRKLLLLFVLGLFANQLAAQSGNTVSYQLPDSISVARGEVFNLPVLFSVEEPWYIYAPTGNNASRGMIETRVVFQLPKGMIRRGKLQSPQPVFKNGFEVYRGDQIRMVQQFQTDSSLKAGDYVITAKVTYQSCKDEICLPPVTEEVQVRVRVTSGGIVKTAEAPLTLAFTAMDGRKVDLEHLRGKLVVIDCWASWCVPCIAEFDNLKKVYAAYHKKGLEIIGINVDEPGAEKRARDLVATHQLPWVQGFEGKGFAGNSFIQSQGIKALPAVFLIDQKGNIVDREARGEKLKKLLRQYFTKE